MQKDVDSELERQKLDAELDKELQDTFPASDPLKITRRPPKPKKQSANTRKSDA